MSFLFPGNEQFFKSHPENPSELPSIPDMFGCAAFLCRLGGVAGRVDPRSYAAYQQEFAPIGEQETQGIGPSPDHGESIRVSELAYRTIEQTKIELAPHLSRGTRQIRRFTVFEQEQRQMRHMTGWLNGRPMRASGALRLRRKLEQSLKVTFFICELIIVKNIGPLWEMLLEKMEEPIHPSNDADELQLPSWAQIAIDLMIVTDSLSEGVSAPHDWSSSKMVQSYPALILSVLAMRGLPTLSSRAEREAESHTTLSKSIPEAILVTLPKCRTPSVGSNLRTISHNLAVLPATGTTRTSWDYNSRSDKSDRSPLNILLIPIPYYLHASSFQPLSNNRDQNWDHFKIKPDWSVNVPPSDFVTFVRDLCKAAVRDVDKIDAIVLPECAVTHLQFHALRVAIEQADESDVFREVEFIVSGASCCELSDNRHQDGNFVLSASFFHDTPTTIGENAAGRVSVNVKQSKHHRWKLHDEQIEGYRLSHVLNKGMTWWEYLPPVQRSLQVMRFRNTQSLMTLICEDLARVDPGQEIVRSIGPDLLIALLMDSAQISARWPARYATVLAEDPGSSVLTLTSNALVHRANEERVRRAKEDGESKCPSLSNSIGLWKDETIWSGTSIKLEKNAEAVVLTISNQHREQTSLDGRVSRFGQHWLWKLTDQRQVKRSIEEQRNGPAFGRVFDDTGWGFDVDAAQKSFPDVKE